MTAQISRVPGGDGPYREVSFAGETSLMYLGHYLGCGYCGTTVPEEYGDWPDCCPRMMEWKRRLRDCIFGPDYVEAPPPEELHVRARWERVARRLQSKHAH